MGLEGCDRQPRGVDVVRAWVGRGRPSDVRGGGLSSSSLRNWRGGLFVNNWFVGLYVEKSKTYLHDDSVFSIDHRCMSKKKNH